MKMCRQPSNCGIFHFYMTDTFQSSSRLYEAFDEAFYSAICTAIEKPGWKQVCWMAGKLRVAFSHWTMK